MEYHRYSIGDTFLLSGKVRLILLEKVLAEVLLIHFGQKSILSTHTFCLCHFGFISLPSSTAVEYLFFAEKKFSNHFAPM